MLAGHSALGGAACWRRPSGVSRDPAAGPSSRPHTTKISAAAPRQEAATSSWDSDQDTSDIPIPRLSYARIPVRPGLLQEPLTHQPAAELLGLLGPASFNGSHHQRLQSPTHTQLSNKQLDSLAGQLLGPGSSVWSADARNRPASTSAPEDLAAFVQGRSAAEIAAKADELSDQGDLNAVLGLLQACDKQLGEQVAVKMSHAKFLDAARLPAAARKHQRPARLAIQLLNHLPASFLTPHVFMRVLQTCAACRDLDTGWAALDVANKHHVKVDEHMYTSLINVCKSVGNVDKAYRVFLDMKAQRLRIDAYVYGVLIATCAEAMKRDLAVAHERKEQYVLLERAFQYVADAEAAGVLLGAPVWNSLLTCAGRCGELNRAFEVLRMMQQRDVNPNAATYGSLIDSCVAAGQAEKATRVFQVAMQKGFVNEVKLYTQAISACMIPGASSWSRAMDIYAAMQRAGVKPDKKFFACLISVAGRTGQLAAAFELVEEMAAEGIMPSPTTAGALIHACMSNDNLALARRVYDLCSRHDTYPAVSHFNRLMDRYASEKRFGEVVSLLSDMVASGRQPNLNTYRILINACVRADQAGLAFKVFALMQANRIPILQQKFAQTIYYSLAQACFNQTRYRWSPPEGYPPRNPEGHVAGAGLPAVRQMEADKVLAALGGDRLTGAHRSNPFDQLPDSIDWAGHAISIFHHMLGKGHKPSISMLDKLLNCTRIKMLPEGSAAEGAAAVTPGLAPAASAPPFVGAPFVQYRPQEVQFEVAFDSRAFSLLEEAVSRGLLPRFDPEAPTMMDMRGLPPAVAEVYVLHMLLAAEKHASRAASQIAAEMAAVGTANLKEATKRVYYHPITLLVPPFDLDLVKWPSYVKRLTQKYTLELSDEERARLHTRLNRGHACRRRRAAAAQRADDEAAAARRGIYGGDQAYDEDAGVSVGTFLEADGGVEDAALCDVDWEHDGLLDAGAPGGGQYVADSTTGLAVAATFIRMKVWMSMDCVNGVVTINPKEMGRWIKRRRQAKEAGQGQEQALDAAAAAAGRASAGSATAHAGSASQPGRAVRAQQRNIRSGSLGADPLGPPAAAMPGMAGAYGTPTPGFGMPGRMMGVGMGPRSPTGLGPGALADANGTAVPSYFRPPSSSLSQPGAGEVGPASGAAAGVTVSRGLVPRSSRQQSAASNGGSAASSSNGASAGAEGRAETHGSAASGGSASATALKSLAARASAVRHNNGQLARPGKRGGGRRAEEEEQGQHARPAEPHSQQVDGGPGSHDHDEAGLSSANGHTPAAANGAHADAGAASSSSTSGSQAAADGHRAELNGNGHSASNGNGSSASNGSASSSKSGSTRGSSPLQRAANTLAQPLEFLRRQIKGSSRQKQQPAQPSHAELTVVPGMPVKISTAPIGSSALEAEEQEEGGARLAGAAGSGNQRH